MRRGAGSGRLVPWSLALGTLVLVAGCGPAVPPQAPGPLPTPEFLERPTVPSEVHAADPLPPPPEVILSDPILGSPLLSDEDLERQVYYWVFRWQTWGYETFSRYLQRMALYEGLVDEEVRKRDLPRSLRYLPLVESGYNPSAVSRAGAAGLWQFMSGTARFVGMDVTQLLDERRDPWVATGYALDYLVELHDRFEGSWFLALAAYNGGWGRVQRIINRHGNGAAPSDSLFWALRQHFPRETRDYVPKLLAAARLAENPRTYGFEPGVPLDAGWAEEVRVPDATSLDVVARAAGVSMEEVERMNPHLRRGYTPPDRETALRVPRGAAERFREAYARIPADERVSFVEHRIGRGETLSHVADRYRVPLSELRAANPRLNPRRLRIGQWVVVPRSPSPMLAAAAAVRTTPLPAAPSATTPQGPRAEEPATAVQPGTTITHRVSSGESLWRIARRYWVHVSEIRAWNDLGPDYVLKPGDVLEIRGAQVGVYRVRPGDTLSEIAMRHGIETDRLMRANGLGGGAVLRPGDEVRIPSQ